MLDTQSPTSEMDLSQSGMEGSQSVSRGKRTKKSLSKRAMSIEEVFGQVSTITSSSIIAPPTKLVLTPRSASSCLKHGINPEILKLRDLDSFWDSGIDPEIQRMRHEVYGTRRHDLMKIARSERRRIINMEADKNSNNDGGGGEGESLSPAQLLAQAQKQNSTLVEIEERRLSKMRRRQEKELEQMLQFEVKMNELQAQMKKKADQEKANDERRGREKEKRMRAMAEERRLRELRRKAQEDAEEAMRNQVSAEMFERDMKILEDKKRAERRAKMQARINDEERARKIEEHRLESLREAKAKAAELKRISDERDYKEAVRAKKVEDKRLRDQDAAQRRRQEVQDRILMNLHMSKQREEKRKADFFEKKEYHERLRFQALSEAEKDREMRNRENYLMEQKRQLTLQATREKEEMDKEVLRKKFEDDARFVEQLGAERSKELALAKERENLNKQLKLENVERIKRIQEYKRLETLRKISEGDQRTQDMLKRKEEIIEQRRMAGLKTKMQKDEIMSVLESSRANGGRAIQMLQDVLLNDTAKSTKKKTKKGKTMERSSSAGNDETFNPTESLGPPPDAPSLKARMAKTDNAGAMPYKSPYEGGEEYMGNETVTF